MQLTINASVIVTGETVLENYSMENTSHLNEDNGVETHFEIVPTKISPVEILYGNFSYELNRWKDGLFTSVLRHYQNMSGQCPKWIVLDGNIVLPGPQLLKPC